MSGRRLLILVLLVPITLVLLSLAFYQMRGGEAARPAMVAERVPQAYPNSPVAVRSTTRWLQDANDAASPRTPHTSMRTLEAFVAERVALAARQVGGDAPVSVSGDAESGPLAAAVRERLGTQWGGLLSNEAPARIPNVTPRPEPSTSAGDASPAASTPVEVDVPAGPADALPGVEPPHASPPPLPPPSPADEFPPVVPRRDDRLPESVPVAPADAVAPVPAAPVEAGGAPVAALPVGGPGATGATLTWRDVRDVHVPWWPVLVRRGTLVAVVSGAGGNATFTADLDEKPWLETPPGDVGRTAYVVTSSSSPAASPADAEAEARRMTTELFVAHLDDRVRAMPGGTRVTRDELHRQAAVHLAHNTLDRAVVRVDRPYGPVWYAAELVEVVPGMIQTSANAAVQTRAVRTRTLVGTIVALPGMLLVLGAVYLGLNALTRGYFRGPLRAAALTVVAVVVLVAVLFVLG